MTEPTPFGWFHFIFLTLTVLACAFAVYKCRNITEKQLRKVLLSTSIVLIALEIYKQINCAYNAEEDSWGYAWSAFPFQFCSSPLYIMPLAVIVRRERLRRRLYAFLGSYCLVAGLIVMLYPSTVFTETVGVNIQTMLHHGIMFVVGVMLYASGVVKMRPKSAIPALPIFFILLTIAMILNISIYPIIEGDSSQAFNMFYISPYYDCTLPFLSMFANDIPYILFFFIYALGFTGLAFLMPCISKLFGLISLGISKFFALFAPKKAEEAAPQSSDNSANSAE